MVSDTIRNTVAVKFIAENITGRTLVAFILVLNRCTGKAKEHSCRKYSFNALECISKS